MNREKFVETMDNISRMYSKYIEFRDAVEKMGCWLENDLINEAIVTAAGAVNASFGKRGVVEAFVFGYLREVIEDLYPEDLEKTEHIYTADQLYDYLVGDGM